MKKNKILLLGIVMLLSLSLSGCHMQRQSNSDNYFIIPTIENDDSYEEDNDGNNMDTEKNTVVVYGEPSTISEFHVNHQDLIDEIEYEINRAEERLILQMEEFVAGTWENVQDTYEILEIIDGSFIRKINNEVVEEGFLYTYVALNVYWERLKGALIGEYETLLNDLLRDVKKVNFENLRWQEEEPSFAFYIVEDNSDQTVDQTYHTPFIRIRYAYIMGEQISLEPIGISVNLRAFRRSE